MSTTVLHSRAALSLKILTANFFSKNFEINFPWSSNVEASELFKVPNNVDMLPLMGVEEEELLVIGFKGEEEAEAEDFFFIDGRSNNKTKSASRYLKNV